MSHEPFPTLHQRRTVIAPLQVVRGIAASFVVVVHLLERLVKRGQFAHGLPSWAMYFGEVGVTTFFAISGFIMVYTTSSEFGRRSAGQRFLWRRFLRVSPLYYLTSTLMILFQYFTSSFSTNRGYLPPSAAAIVHSILFIPYVDYRGIIQPVYQLGWTLEYEMFFYSLFALALVLPRRLGNCCIIGLLLGLVVTGTTIDRPDASDALGIIVYFFTRPVLIYFVIGMAIAWLLQEFGPTRRRVPSWIIAVISLIALGLGVRFGSNPAYLIAAVTIAVAASTLLQKPETSPSSFEVMSRAFGDSSYSIYLTHSFFLGAIAASAMHLPLQSPLSIVLFVIATCFFCAAIGWLVWRFVETPVTRALRGRSRRADENVAP